METSEEDVKPGRAVVTHTSEECELSAVLKTTMRSFVRSADGRPAQARFPRAKENAQVCAEMACLLPVALSEPRQKVPVAMARARASLPQKIALDTD